MNDSKKSILIVEDDVSSQQYYRIVLDDFYELQIVPIAADAKALLKKHNFELAIIDLSLPGAENGQTLIRHIRTDLGLDLPILAITAHAFSQNRIAAMEAGATEYYTKPILSNELLEAIERVSP